MSTQTQAPVTRRRRSHRSRDWQWAIVFLAPAIIALLVLRVAPAISALISSLYKAFPGGIREPEFAGLFNYRSLFSDPAFGNTVARTILFNLVINPLQVFIALVLAVLLTQRIKLAGLWRTFLFVPVTVPIVGSCIAWAAILNPQGPLNAIISLLGGNPQPFLTSPQQALGSIMLIASWVGIGYWMMFLIAGIGGIPEELYEAARVDGASPLRTFFSITLPLLKRPLLFVLVADTVANFVLFVPIQALTQGGPESSTNLLMFSAYRTTYGYGSRNLGAAEIMVLTVIMLAFVLLQFRLLRVKED